MIGTSHRGPVQRSDCERSRATIQQALDCGAACSQGARTSRERGGRF
ncbi:unnamed protein product [Staurois parvus]|uniref:Uncharacterized protein n=1 Tax=Staurois parvus TaxID=386267 RepID=A0ABN9AEP0_9NEOB|nr:unnamed protein product [Staurois parvus]